MALSILAQVIEDRQNPRHIRATLRLLDVEPAATSVDVAIDPICHMSVPAVASSIHADVDGARWYFCCPGCKSAFLADPAAYAGA